MTIRKRGSDRTGRDKLRSPGRPKLAHRYQRVLFWRLIAKGLSSEDAAVQVGASAPVGSRWFREAGGMIPSQFSKSAPPLSRRYLRFSEREEIALHRAQGLGVCAIARKLEGQRLQSRVSCVGMQQRAVAGSSTVQRRLSGMRIVLHNAPK